MPTKTPDMKLDPEAFRAWLETKPPDAVVGTAGRSDRCPLARYAEQSLKAPAPFVRERRWSPDTRPLETGVPETTAPWQPLAQWAQDFVADIDDAALDDAIFAAEALRALDAALEFSDAYDVDPSDAEME